MLKLIRVLSLVCLLALTIAAAAQTRPRTTPRRRTPTSTRTTRNAKPTPAGATALNEARLRVADKIKVLTKFLYLYARTSKELEATEAAARTGGQLPPQIQTKLEQNRAQLRGNLQNVRAGLDELELYFKTTPGADAYYQSLAGVAATAADAENKVTAGQLDAAGRALLDVVNRLTDVLIDMQ
ncbi:MAG TPA: hypothetical protein VF525_15360 [Pyrinomonadaceae bacterium]